MAAAGVTLLDEYCMESMAVSIGKAGVTSVRWADHERSSKSRKVIRVIYSLLRKRVCGCDPETRHTCHQSREHGRLRT